jgi:hypothetical protein
VGVAREKRVADCGRGRACERRRSEGAGGRRGRPARANGKEDEIFSPLHSF